ncbi:MAG TPA: MFS transporter [Abditibacteriaceae bacterium]
MTFDHTRRACYTGYITQAIVNNLAPLLFIVFQTLYHISYEMLGRLVLLNFATQLITDFVAIKVVDRVGYRTPLVLAHALSVLGLVLLAILPALLPSPYLGLCLAIIVYAIGGGLLEVLVSPGVEALPTPPEAKAGAMSLLHSFYCWGQVGVVIGTTLLLKQTGHLGWPILPLVWAIVPLINLMVFRRVPLPPTIADEHRTSLRSLFSMRVFVFVLVLMFCAGATELTMSQWSSLFAEQGLGLPKVWGDLAGPCLFAILMGIGRFSYGLWGEKIPLVSAMIVCGAGATLCYLTAALASNPIISLIGCAGCGLAVCLMWPGTFSLAAARFPLGGTAMFGVLALFRDAGAALGPWLIGWGANSITETKSVFGSFLLELTGTGLRAGLLMGTVFPVFVVIGALLYRNSTREHTARDGES